MSQITWDEMVEQYQPTKNHIDTNASFNGEMFETSGPQYDFVCTQPVDKVWTIVEDDDGNPVACTGFHHINRLGYFVMTITYKQDITASDDMDMGEEE